MTRLARDPRLPLEEDEQRTVVQWLAANRILFTHVPNGGQRSRIEAAIMNGLGVQAGVPDLLIFDPPPALPTLRAAAVEMKRQKGGVVSPQQKDWLRRLDGRMWATAVCQGADEAIRQLEAWGYGNRKEVP